MLQIIVKGLSDKIHCLVLFFFVSFSLFFSENVFAKQSAKKFITIEWNPERTGIRIKAIVYDYSDPSTLKYGFLESCRFEVSATGESWYKLMDINVPRQRKTNTTEVNLLNKFKDARIYLIRNTTKEPAVQWLESSSAKKEVHFYNEGERCMIGLVWYPDKEVISYIRIKARWHHEDVNLAETLNDGVYCLKNSNMLKSNASGINTNVLKNDTGKVLKESDEIVIKGAKSGSNIMVYTTSGTEIKSVVSNSDVVRLEVPANQIYIVHVGNSRHKVAM